MTRSNGVHGRALAGIVTLLTLAAAAVQLAQALGQ